MEILEGRRMGMLTTGLSQQHVAPSVKRIERELAREV